MAKKAQDTAKKTKPAEPQQEKETPVVEEQQVAADETQAPPSPTVYKQIGGGGPMPVIAPKQNTIQLQPIIVPLAVVPYMTQDSNVLRTDNRPQPQYVAAVEDYGEATEFEAVEENMDESASAKKNVGITWQPRVYSLVTLLLSTILFLPYILSYFFPLGVFSGMGVVNYNLIGTIALWIRVGGVSFLDILFGQDIIMMAIALLDAIVIIVSFIGLLAGKYSKVFFAIVGFFIMGFYFGMVVPNLIILGALGIGGYVVIIEFVISLVSFICALAFAGVLNSLENNSVPHREQTGEI